MALPPDSTGRAGLAGLPHDCTNKLAHQTQARQATEGGRRGAEVAGLRRKLHNKLSPLAAALRTDWDVGEFLGALWRPSFDSQLYPYLPPHVTRPAEVRKLYVVTLPPKCYFAVRLQR